MNKYIQYSKEIFEKNEKTGQALLIDRLERDIKDDMHEVVLNRFNQIVNELNKNGHNLREYTITEPGDIHYRDDIEKEGEKYKCDLRFAVDIVISVGFRDTIDIEDENEDDFCNANQT